MINATAHIDQMIRFGLHHGLIDEADALFSRNLLMDALGLPAPEPCEPDDSPVPETLTPILGPLCDHAAQRGIISDSPDECDRFATRLCGLITPAPSAVRDQFFGHYQSQGPEAATSWFYELCKRCDYIRVDQIARNLMFPAPSPYGELIITINLSKPEKDPRDIAALLNAESFSYPPCMLCVENPGYAGRPGFPARQNHRMIPLTLNAQPWHMQYSPYLYYDEHCILLNQQHIPMHIDRGNLLNMFAFVDLFPHYFIGSNADLPIVGGSILNHDHFQGGRYLFPMDRADTLISLRAPVDDVKAEVANWPMSCVRLRGKDRQKLLDLAERMLDGWRSHSDPDCDILSHTDAPHNTITPTLRKDGDDYLLNLVLRNNRTTKAHPMGLFHPHADLHHIKKENIGLIEVMGLFILPGRLLSELDALAEYLTGQQHIDTAPGEDSPLAQHYPWICTIAETVGTALSKPEAEAAIRSGLAKKCARVLEDAGVYKLTPGGRAGLMRFLRTLGYEEM